MEEEEFEQECRHQMIKSIRQNVRRNMELAAFIRYLGHPKYTILVKRSYLGEERYILPWRDMIAHGGRELFS